MEQQLSFVDSKYQIKRHQTRKEKFLARVDALPLAAFSCHHSESSSSSSGSLCLLLRTKNDIKLAMLFALAKTYAWISC